jgi:hypothetical protein
MKKSCLIWIALLPATMVMAAEDFDGSAPMACQPEHGHDCLPTEQACTRLQPKSDKDLTVRIDVKSKTVRTPYRNDLLPIQNVTNNTKALVLQGTTLDIVWSATVQRATGKLTITIADREGAYVIFGQCKLASAK